MTDLLPGVRRYTCLTPIVVLVDGQALTTEHIHLLPVTRRIEREWQDGLIDGEYGMLEALIDRLTFEPYAVIEEMQHPDVEHFNKLFLTHIPTSMATAIASGQFPVAAAPPYNPGPPDDDEPAPYGGWDDPGPAPVAPTRPTPPTAPAVDPAPAQGAHLDGGNFEIAQTGPDQSLGTPEQQARARAAFEEKRQGGGDGLEMARGLVAEGDAAPPASPLEQAIQRTRDAAMQPGPTIAPGWQPTSRDPFDPSPAPPKQSVNKPPTRISAESPASLPIDQALPGTAAQVAPAAPAGVDPRTKREAVYEPKGDYVPDMSAAGFEEPQRAGMAQALGIGDLQP